MNWRIEDNSLDQTSLLKNESIFNVANGYIGVRGNFEEGYSHKQSTIRGTYINAFFEEAPITYGESAYGFPDTMQKIVNVIDSQDVTLAINGEEFSLFEGEVKSFRRWLDMKQGIYTREIHWVSPKQDELKITIQRIASFETLELFAIHYRIEPIQCQGELTITSGINGNVENYTNPNDPRVGAGHAKLLDIVHVGEQEGILQVMCTTKASKLQVAATTMHHTCAEAKVHMLKTTDSVAAAYTFEVDKAPIYFTKYTIFTDSRRHEEPAKRGMVLVKKVYEKGLENLFESQAKYLEEFWQLADISIGGDEKLQQGLRFNVYQLLQGVGKDKLSNITAKGLSGEGYEGHYFWDTEIYILPFFILCNPDLAKQLLRYRYTILDEARQRAKELGHQKGAAYAWRTITGKECSAYFPAGTAQYHINGDIAYTYIQYYLATGDEEFIKTFGAEVIFETARIWLEIGHFHEGKFKINAVTGPDEYTAIVNNNYYTNALAKYNLAWAAKWYNHLKEVAPEVLQNLQDKLNLTEAEIETFIGASEAMYLPYNEILDIHEQDDTFLAKKPWDFANTPKESYPLLLHYHPLTIYRHKVLKQADTVLSHFLLEEGIKEETLKHTYDYYEKLTTHDSSLSCAIYSIMASKIGYEKKAYDYFIETARLDLDNTHGNTKDGLHMANMGGTWMSIVYGFAGVRIKADHLALNPNLPKQWQHIAFSLRYKQAKIQVKIHQATLRLEIETNSPIQIKVKEHLYTIEGNQILTLGYLGEKIVQPKAFIFDLDGVLTDTAKYHYQAWKKLADELGYYFDEEINEKLKGVSRLRSFEIILEANDAVDAYSQEQKEILANQKNDLYVKLIRQVTEEDILPGIKQLLLEAREAGIYTAVASASRNAMAILERLGIKDLFDYVADASLIKQAKPDPEVFLNCVQALGVQVKECVGFEDAEAGVQALEAIKMCSVGIHVVSEQVSPTLHLDHTGELDFERILEVFRHYNETISKE